MYTSTNSVPRFLSRQLSLNTGALDRAAFNRRAEIARLNEHLATGKSVNRPSDDPAAFDVARAMDETLGRFDQYLRTINSSRLWIDETEASLTRIGDHLTRAYESGLRAANATLTQDDRNAIADELEGLLETVLSELNSQVAGEYLFAGGASKTKPFERDASGSSDGAGVTYYGDAAARTRTIGDDLAVDINLTGDVVATLPSGTTLTESLSDLIDAIRVGDSDQISAATDGATKARDHILRLVASTGGTAQRMSFAEEQLRESILHAESRRSGAEDADIAQTVTDLQQHQLGLQAATQALLAIRQLHITNFL